MHRAMRGPKLLRLLAAHPQFEVVAATASSHEGMAVADLQPALAAAYPGLRFGSEAGAADGADVVFAPSARSFAAAGPKLSKR